MDEAQLEMRRALARENEAKRALAAKIANALIVHLEDPPGSEMAACNGMYFENPRSDDRPHLGRTLCTGCHNAAFRR